MTQKQLNALGAEVGWLKENHPDKVALITMGDSYLYSMKALCERVPAGYEEKYGPLVGAGKHKAAKKEESPV